MKHGSLKMEEIVPDGKNQTFMLFHLTFNQMNPKLIN